MTINLDMLLSIKSHFGKPIEELATFRFFGDLEHHIEEGDLVIAEKNDVKKAREILGHEDIPPKKLYVSCIFPSQTGSIGSPYPKGYVSNNGAGQRRTTAKPRMIFDVKRDILGGRLIKPIKVFDRSKISDINNFVEAKGALSLVMHDQKAIINFIKNGIRPIERAYRVNVVAGWYTNMLQFGYAPWSKQKDKDTRPAMVGVVTFYDLPIAISMFTKKRCRGMAMSFQLARAKGDPTTPMHKNSYLTLNTIHSQYKTSVIVLDGQRTRQESTATKHLSKMLNQACNFMRKEEEVQVRGETRGKKKAGEKKKSKISKVDNGGWTSVSASDYIINYTSSSTTSTW